MKILLHEGSKRNALFFLCFIISQLAFSQNSTLPLFSIEKLKYEGAFIIPGGTLGESRSDFGSSKIAYNSVNNSLFLAGIQVDGAVAEFGIPNLSMSTDLNQLNIAPVIQNFKKILNLPPSGNPQNINRISGLAVYNGSLIVNAIEYYDASATNSHTTLTLSNASDLSSSPVNGYYSLQGAAHIAGWLTPLSADWQIALGSPYLAGSSSAYPINGRLCMGVSAFGIDPNLLTGSASGIITTDTWMDFDLNNTLYADYTMLQNANYNILSSDPAPPGGGHTAADINLVVGNNDLWTEESSAAYGFIVPHTRTYLTIGYSAGHNSGIGYKALQSDGNICGGPCPFDADDYYNYYWLWDMNDLLAVKNGSMNAYDLRPYDYGVFDAPFQTDVYQNIPEFHPIEGASFDESSDILYITLYDGGAISQFAKNPLILAYKVIHEEICDNLDNDGDGQIDEHKVNSWVGPLSGQWYEDPSYWSLCHFPNSCNHVTIDPSYTIEILNGQTAYAYTLDVKQNASLSVGNAAELRVVIND